MSEIEFTENMALEEVFSAVDQLRISLPDDPRMPGEFTIQEYADHLGVDRDTAHERLARLARQEKLLVRKAKINHRSTNLYRMP